MADELLIDGGPDCPRCGEKGYPILWGMPIFDPDDPHQFDDVIIGGCCIVVSLDGRVANTGCQACGAQWCWEGQLDLGNDLDDDDTEDEDDFEDE
jgi:hypothetical protein